ncbi:hypothetical protein [Halosimplex amylolyticum]|uniref:hypothetical protein n=1 Tax=Halosimplex amylolyticum TaxID=3396616 RepID=UPI003F5611BD
MPSDDCDRSGNTRRRFLGGALGGALAATLGGTATGSTADASRSAQDDPEISCSSVSNLKYGTTVLFTDGSYISAAEGGSGTFGSPGRIVDSINIEGEVTEVDQDCDPGELATTFTDSSATVTGSEENALGVPDTAIVTLHYADGAKQDVLESGEHTGVGEPNDPDGLSTTYRGEGEHAGKTIEAIEFNLTSFDKTVYLRNQEVGEHLLGKRTPSERVVEIVGAGPGDVEYEFTADGAVETASLTDRIGAGGNDDITDNGDGTWTVEGFTGNTGYGDAYVVNGEITSFEQTGGDGEWVVREFDRRVTRSSLDETDLLRIVGTESGDVEYEFTVDGLVWKVTNIGRPLRAEDNDDVTDNGDGTWTVEGFTGNEGQGDTYVVAGDVTDFTRTGGDADFRIERDGREVTPEELVDQ